MVIFFVGLGLFLLGVIVVILARAQEARSTAGTTDGFFKWFLEVLRHWFEILTGDGADTWERVGAAGSIVSALGVLTAVVGLVAWAAA